jgi:hypothetical protein
MSLSRSPRRILILASFVLVLTSDARAQITNVTNSTSTPTPGSGHDYIKMLAETVNPANGSVSIRLDTSVPRARQLTLPFSFAYDSGGAHVLGSSNGQGGFGTNQTFLSQGGWSYAVPFVSANETYKIVKHPDGTTEQCPIYTDFLFQGPSGDRHALRLASAYRDTYCTFTSYLSGGDDFFHANLPCVSGLCSWVKVADESGTVFDFSNAFTHNTVGGFGASLPDFVEDRNGNKIIITDNNNGAFAVTDTAGRTAVSSSGFGASGNTVTVSGLGGTYTVYWGTASSNFSVNAQAVYPSNECRGMANSSGTQAVITAITLPNGQQYQFSYESTYGLLSQITYPTGAWIKYTWALNPQSEFAQFPDLVGNVSGCTYTYDWPALSHRYISFDGTNTALQQDFSYNPPTAWNSSRTAWVTKTTLVTTHDLVRGGSFQTTYVYAPVTVPNPPYDYDAFAAEIPVESTVTYRDWNGSTLRTSTKTWADQYRMSCESITLPTGSISRIDYTYGAGLELTDTKDWDWGQAPACGTATNGTPTRETATTYQSFGNTPIYTNAASILDRPCSVITYGNGTRIAETDYFYDGSASSTPCAAAATQALSGPGNYTGHDETNYGTSSMPPRGNITTTSRQCLQSCSSAVTTYTYDETGQALFLTDACGNATCSDVSGSNHTTQYFYNDSYSSCGGSSRGRH